jgi:hypothetical protein
MSRTYICTATFWYHDADGENVYIPVGTRVAEGHSMLQGREDLFKEDDPVIIESDTPVVRRGPGRPPKQKD